MNDVSSLVCNTCFFKNLSLLSICFFQLDQRRYSDLEAIFMSYSNNMIADLDPIHKAFHNIAGVFLDMPIGLYNGPHMNDFAHGIMGAL